MTDPVVLAGVIDAIRATAHIPKDVPISSESRLVEDLAIDSLDLVGILVKIQDHFDVAIDDEDVGSLRRVSDVAAHVSRCREATAA